MKTVLVTGANGHIGSNTVRSLLKRGYKVIPFVRKNSNLHGIKNLGLQYKYGDVLDYQSILEAARECDAIIHHAAVYRMWAKDPDEIIVPALEGTRNIFKAAKESRVGRVVYTSSMVAVGYSRDQHTLRSEKDWNDFTKTPYYIAKTKSEKEAIRLSDEYGIPTIRLCPTHVIGPYDYKITPSNGSVLNLINKTVPAYEAGTNYVHSVDVGEIHALAVEIGEPGKRYIIGGENLHLKELSTLITKFTGVKPGYLGVTGPIASLVGSIAGLFSKVTGKEPAFDEKVVHDVIGWYGYFDCSLANETFGITPRLGAQIVKDTIRWLLFLNKINPAVAMRIAKDFAPNAEW